MNDLEFLTVKEVAKILHMSDQTVRYWIKTGKLKAIKVNDGPRTEYRVPNTEIIRLHAEAYEEKK